MTPKELLLLLVPILSGIVTLLGVVLLHHRERERTRTQSDNQAADRAATAAQKAIEAALTERGLERRVERMEGRHEELCRELARAEREQGHFREQLPREFLRREDYVEGQARTERRLDKIYELLTALTTEGRNTAH